MTSPTPVRGGSAVPPFARTAVGAVAAAVAAVHLVVGALGRGLYFDEALMVALGRNHLAWGSADQPPLAPALARLADLVAPGVNGMLRVVPSLATAGAVVVAALIARELGGSRRAQVLTALAQATGVVAAMFGHYLTPYSLEPLQWLVVLWLPARWNRIRDDRLLLAVGPVLGLAALTRFQVVLLGVVLVLACAAVGPRDLLRRPAFWCAAATGAVIASPTMVWQAVHGWPQLGMGAVVAEEAFLFGGAGPSAAMLVLVSGPLATVLIVVGLVAAFTGPHLRPHRYLAVAFLLLWIFFAVTVGRPYYLCGVHAVCAALGAVRIQHLLGTGIRWPSRAVLPVAGLAVLLAVGVLPAGSAWSDPGYADRVTAEVARAYAALPEDQRERAVVYSGSYVHSAYLDTADPALDLPPSYGGNRSYGYFDPPPDERDAVLFVGRDPTTLAPAGVRLRPVAEIGDGDRIWFGDGMDRPWSQVWPQLRTLAVS
ncbi:Dolichyl-phosphate-mannose-protein mannosyltransferase family [Pseudonocardia sp. Ae168_Ps1]|uniref:glycosyltransferase family 39 protein n=1 Tax=unclassified Pseudonocardia TaxID=2619320 RepID=UPI00094B6597|nr:MULTISPECIES: glycosyltransferase family 39 protein [unclassified Pseudonocardia]OLL74510.1 Dolichyl-phosphate-mannose-protein mannosyltransferase family [Pseudonocardia sp. Ae150A_Ps1]OLL80490.1 Dolichyl-phosphate-mannose-protein mannosyltransferase family [Pseudonocardia sp. Ae168_Ps1]OLL85383.1 Dolichyl-phosphate-mannose-protein mannosyltransferase family [Pseudonocardia sp. Ae263_Ps1]OLL94590.1 Dolichyl-phosphate-mannose-protein mannosyltransferase family [Pseudonocardia sp. Ae356_Ps1]